MLFMHTSNVVISGGKTQTRRPVKRGDMVREDGKDYTTRDYHKATKVAEVIRHGRVQYAVGREYGVQTARGQRSVARIRLLSIEFVPVVRAISAEDVKAEGFGSPQQFLKLWRHMHGPRAADDPAWKLTFEVVAVVQGTGRMEEVVRPFEW